MSRLPNALSCTAPLSSSALSPASHPSRTASACAGPSPPLRVEGAPPLRCATELGRTAAYATLGAVTGGAGQVVTSLVPASVAAALASWSLAIALGFAALRLWRRGAGATPEPALVALSRGPRSPSRLERLVARLPRGPFALGLLTGALPCGALGATLVVAAGTGRASAGALLMLAFVTTSGLGLFAAGTLARRAARMARPAVVRSLAVVLALGAVMLALRPIAVPRGGHAAGHEAVHLAARTDRATPPCSK